MAALPCCAEEDVEAGSAALRVDRPVYPRPAEHNTVAEGGNRRWAETARRPVGLIELADDPENVVRDVQQASLKKGNAAPFPPQPAALVQSTVTLGSEPLYCSTWQQITTCQGPGGYVSHEWSRDGMRFGQDNQGDRWSTSRWQGIETTTVTPPRDAR